MKNMPVHLGWLSLLVCLLVVGSLTPISQAQGLLVSSDVYACYNLFGGSSSITFGGRVIHPNSVLQVVGSTNTCPSGEQAINLNSPTPATAAPSNQNLQQIAQPHWYDANQTFPTITLGNIPQGMAFDGTNIWVANQLSNNVTKIRANDGSVVGTYSVGSNNPVNLVFDGTYIWSTNHLGGSVTKLKASDGSIVGFYAVGGLPWGIAFDGTNIWVSSLASSFITKLKASDGSVVGTYTVGSWPAGIAFDGTNIWVANSSSKQCNQTEG